MNKGICYYGIGAAVERIGITLVGWVSLLSPPRVPFASLLDLDVVILDAISGTAELVRMNLRHCTQFDQGFPLSPSDNGGFSVFHKQSFCDSLLSTRFLWWFCRWLGRDSLWVLSYQNFQCVGWLVFGNGRALVRTTRVKMDNSTIW